ncbi:MAG: hypothetical protein IT384_22500 [Deltaproteobacteria bacterium]|nr:hypothetical protein [Deltaproteobacteria bacterium]
MAASSQVDRDMRARAFAKIRRAQHQEQAQDMTPAERIARAAELSAFAYRVAPTTALAGSDEPPRLMLDLAAALRRSDLGPSR